MLKAPNDLGRPIACSLGRSSGNVGYLRNGAVPVGTGKPPIAEEAGPHNRCEFAGLTHSSGTPALRMSAALISLTAERSRYSDRRYLST